MKCALAEGAAERTREHEHCDVAGAPLTGQFDLSGVRDALHLQRVRYRSSGVGNMPIAYTACPRASARCLMKDRCWTVKSSI